MDLKVNIPIFLQKSLKKQKLSLIEFSRQSGISYQTIKPLHIGMKFNPELKTILKIAEFFACSIDEVVGRDPKYFSNNNSKYNFLEIDQISSNLKLFITTKCTKHNLTLSRLSINIGFNGGFLSNFIQEYNPVKSLSTLSVCKIAEYFEVSIDEMIGRISYDSKESDDISDNKNQDPQT